MRSRVVRTSILLLSLVLLGTASAAPARIPARERAALVALYEATGGPRWTSRLGWRGRAGTECSWQGVACDPSGTTVTGLSLASNRLDGELPAALADLPNLRTLNLSSNALHGPIPPELGRLSRLENLDLSFNRLSGEVPDELGDLSALRVLGLRNNRLSRLPDRLGDLDRLVALSVSRNLLSELPTGFQSGLESLVFLEAADNRLTTFPPAVLEMRSLQHLDLEANRMEGPIPPGIGELRGLVFLNLASNRLSGPLPAEIGNLSNLRALHLGDNELTEVPVELARLASLERLELSANRLTEIPALADLTRLKSLDLSGNPLAAGPVPEWLRDVKSLEELKLRGTGRTGEIPAWLPELRRLTWLDLSYNPFLEGSAPAFLAGLSRLRRLFLSGASLTGPFPDWLAEIPTLRILALRDNAFEPGPVPEALLETLLSHLDLGHTNRTGTLPVSLPASLRVLRLDRNHLGGGIPPAWGALHFEVLDLHANRLTGAVPPEIAALSHLRDEDGLDLRWNGLSQSDPGLIAFLDRKQVGGNWRSTQTIPPHNLTASLSGATRIRLSWTPIRFQEGEGAYDVFHSTSPNGPFLRIGRTADKHASTLEISNLAPRRRHFFLVRTTTEPHARNANRIVSHTSPVVHATTLPN